MAVLSQEEFFNRLHERIGDDTTDESIAFMEDMTDTYNDLTNRINANNSVDWEKKYNEMNEAWKKKYKHRFLTASGGNPDYRSSSGKEDDDYNPEAINYGDLFKDKK